MLLAAVMTSAAMFPAITFMVVALMMAASRLGVKG